MWNRISWALHWQTSWNLSFHLHSCHRMTLCHRLLCHKLYYSYFLHKNLFTLKYISKLLLINKPISISINKIKHRPQILPGEQPSSFKWTGQKLRIIDHTVFICINTLHYFPQFWVWFVLLLVLKGRFELFEWYWTVVVCVHLFEGCG